MPYNNIKDIRDKYLYTLLSLPPLFVVFDTVHTNIFSFLDNFMKHQVSAPLIRCPSVQIV